MFCSQQQPGSSKPVPRTEACCSMYICLLAVYILDPQCRLAVSCSYEGLTVGCHCTGACTHSSLPCAPTAHLPYAQG